MAQSLLIGLGGTGSRVVNNVVKLLKKNRLAFNDGQICCAVLDTNTNDMGDIRRSGTDVPVYETSKPQRISDYLDQYNHLNVREWCPVSPAFLTQSMLDGCSEVRVKSRLAFLDCLNTETISNLGTLINDVLKNNEGSKIRVMIVSSLSGGTGSGMFIQVALWLREYLAKSQITIRGIFLLPDVFVSTIKDIRESAETRTRHYANAYAAIRELNALTKIRKNISLDLSEKITLGTLFDSERDADNGEPVYDFSFFIDNRDENGVSLSSISEYEQMAAQLVYMQLYSPMKDDMYSEEDNAFLSFVSNDEPLYGTCGTAKAEYPVRSVKTYCAIRATQESIKTGWRKIDSEIEARIEEKKAAERDGVFTSEAIDPRFEYVKLFDEKIAVKPEEAGRDRFFISIAKDVKNETKIKSKDGKVTVKYTDKIDDFIKMLKSKKIETFVTQNSHMDDFAIDAESFVSADHSKEELRSKILSDESDMEDAVNLFESKVDEYATNIVNTVFPFSMGEVTPKNECSIYGLISKPNEEGTRIFIHPVAMRYLLCKLVANMERELKGIVLDSSRMDALSGGDVGTSIDNPKTKKTETSAMELLDSKTMTQRAGKFLDFFEARYAEFINTKIGLCEKYEKEFLQVSVYNKLMERVKALISQMEAFFKRLSDVQERLDDDLAANIAETDGVVGKTYYVYSDKANKEEIYQAIDLQIGRSVAEINKSVIDSAYGKLCAEKRPSTPENAEFANKGIAASFMVNTINVFRNRIDSDPNNRDIVNMDIFTAICKQADAEKKGIAENEAEGFGELDRVDVEEGTIVDNRDRAARHAEAFAKCKNRLLRMAAPMLTRTNEISDSPLGIITTRQKTFWGFHPAVAAVYPNIGATLQVNADIQADTAYPINELYCYRAVYGLEAKYIPKFNETTGGIYYFSYRAIVDEMVKEAAGRKGERAYVVSPHLDKRWHALLPYTTTDMLEKDTASFFHGFWLAIAYGAVKLNKDGHYCVVRQIDGGFGTTLDDEVEVIFKGRTVGKADIYKLVCALRSDVLFKNVTIPELEKRFLGEIETMDTYVGTAVLKGLTVKNSDLNPVDIVSRYYSGLGKDKRVMALLIGSLESIAGELASKYDLDRSEKRVEEAKFRICKRIYDSSSRVKGKAEVFGKWTAKFNELGIKTDSELDAE